MNRSGTYRSGTFRERPVGLNEQLKESKRKVSNSASLKSIILDVQNQPEQFELDPTKLPGYIKYTDNITSKDLGKTLAFIFQMT